MKELEKPTSSSSKTADDRAYGKRLSPRLHDNVAVHDASLLLDGCSAQRRFSPRLNKNPDLNSSSLRRLSPQLHQTPGDEKSKKREEKRR